MGGKASSGGGSDGDEGNVYWHPLKANSRKRAKLLKPKESGGCSGMDNAMVPRRLRSAMSKRGTHSASPTFPVQKKQLNIAFKSSESFSSYAKKFSSSKIDFVTKDEEEVAEALTALAALVPAGKATQVTINRGNGEKDSKLKPISSFEEEMASRHLIPLRDSQDETKKTEALALDEYVTESQKYDKPASGFAHPEHQNSLSDENGKEVQNEVPNLSNLEAPLKSSSGHGSLQALQLDPLVIQKSSNGLWLIEPPQVEGVLESVKQYPVNGTKYNEGEELSTNLRSVSPSNGNNYLTKSSHKPAETSADCLRLSSTAHDLLTGKHDLASKDKRSSWRRCSAHAYIAHFIQYHQKMENNEQTSLLPNPSKCKDGTCSSGKCPFTEMLPLSTGLSDIAFGGANSPKTEKNASKGRFQVPQDVGVPKTQATPNLGANISLQSPGVTCYSGHEAKSIMQLHIPYLHPRVPQNYSVMPYPYPHGPYNSAYPDQPAAAASCQVHIQLSSHFVGNPFCGQRTVHAGDAATKQYLWQSNIAHYGPPPSPPQGLSKLQNGHHHPDSSLSSFACSQPSSMFPSPSISVGAVVPAEDNRHVMSLLPVTSSSSRAMQQQHEGRHENCECSMECSSHLQLLCKVQNT